MTRRLVLFEDAHWSDLSPLADLTPVHALAFGDSHLAARWIRVVPEARLCAVVARPLVLASWREAPVVGGERPQGDDDTLAINVAALPGPWLASVLQGNERARWMAGERVAGARLRFRELVPGFASGAPFEAFLRGLDLTPSPVEARLIRWPWEVVEWSPEAMALDLEKARPQAAGEVHPLAAVYEPARVSVGVGARVDAYAVLDARSGPIRLGPRAVVLSHTVVTGPCVVGAATQLLGVTRLRARAAARPSGKPPDDLIVAVRECVGGSRAFQR